MEMCMTVYVFGDYTRYIPYYIYSILKSYPDYYVKVYAKDPLSSNEKKSLKLIRNQVSSNFEVIEGYMDKYINSKPSIKMVGGIETTFRFLLPYEEFKDFKYVYIGDVDFLIIRENPSLLDGHKTHLNKIDVPYSNALRANSTRLTGLHFIKVKEYYQKMEPLIQTYLKKPNLLYKQCKYLNNDEEFLYRFIKKGIGFGKVRKHHYRPPHGFHIGIGRKGDDQERKRKIDRYIKQRQLYKQGIVAQLKAYFADPLFKKIMLLSPDKDIEFLEEQLKKF